MSTKVEVTRGVFDPRTYREADPNNAARKRRSDWLAIPGKIHYVRERTVASEERELAEQVKKAEEEKEQPREEVAEDSPATEPEVVRKPIIEKKQESRGRERAAKRRGGRRFPSTRTRGCEEANY